jgi:hypothetical protein
MVEPRLAASVLVLPSRWFGAAPIRVLRRTT